MIYSILPDKQRGVLGSEGHNFYVRQIEQLLHLDLSIIVPKLTMHTSPGPIWGAVGWLVIWIGIIIYLSWRLKQEKTTNTTLLDNTGS
jgi:hypothetical protein